MIFQHTRLQLRATAITGLVLALAFTMKTNAAITNVEVTSRTPWLGSLSFPDVVPYEKLEGRITFAVDPMEKLNSTVADLRLAPRNAAGLVEFTADYVILRPVSHASTSPNILLEILNRGHSQAEGVFFTAAGTDRMKVEHLDGVKLTDPFAFRHGLTLAWLGWQFNLPSSALRLSPPNVLVEGKVREAFTPDDRDAARGVDTLDSRSYCASDTVQEQATLSSKTSFDGPLELVPRDAWRFAQVENGTVKADPCSIYKPGGFVKGRMYEAVYRGVSPAVAGLGLIAVRDFVSYLKYGGVSSPLTENDKTPPLVVGYGYSQSARFLRQYLYQGFTADEKGRKTFDGLFIASAGAGRGSFNHRYAMPGEAGTSVMSDLRPVDLFPFTDGNEVDPLTGQRDGLLNTPVQSATLPKIVYTFSSSEYWARAGSLTYTTVDGSRELPISDNARLYFFAGTPHAHGPFPPDHGAPGEPPYSGFVNFASSKWGFRALLMDLDDWIARDVPPPPSMYPHLGAELVPQSDVRFPKNCGLSLPTSMPQTWRLDFGEDFLRDGVIDNEPPKLGAPYVLRVPQVDQDGNDEGGIALPFLAAPLGTYTGWNHQIVGLEAFNYLAGLIGGFEPFAGTKAARLKLGDPRLSIEERYRDRDDYLQKVRVVEDLLAQNRLILREDFSRIEAESVQFWNGIVVSQSSAAPHP